MLTKPVYKDQPSLARTLRRVRQYWFCYAMLLGTFALLITFSYYPALSAIYHSFTVWDGFRPEKWVGWQNYQEVFASDVIFRKGFVNMLLLTLW